MYMIRKIGLILIFLSSLYLLTVYLGKRNIINEEAEKVQEFMEIEKNDNEFVEEEDYFMILEIPKIKLKRGLYGVNSYLNNVNSNLEILSSSNMPDTQNSNLIIAGHSGNSDVSYFKNLYKL